MCVREAGGEGKGGMEREGFQKLNRVHRDSLAEMVI